MTKMIFLAQVFSSILYAILLEIDLEFFIFFDLETLGFKVMTSYLWVCCITVSNVYSIDGRNNIKFKTNINISLQT